MRAHPDRLAAFATVQPAAGGDAAVAELRRARRRPDGPRRVSPHSQGYAIDDAAFGAVLTLAAELGLPVNLHVTDPASRPYRAS